MKKILCSLAAVMMATNIYAGISLQFPKTSATTYKYQTTLISEGNRPQNITEGELQVVDGKASLPDPGEPSHYMIDMGDKNYVTFYAAPGEKLDVEVSSVTPLSYTVKGTELMEGVVEFTNRIRPVRNKYMEASRKEPVDTAELNSIERQYDNIVKTWLFENRKSPAAIYALMNLEGQDFLDQFNALTAEAKASIIFPYAKEYQSYVMRQLEAEQKMAEMQNGHFTAPAFTLKNVDGKDVSLSDFKGKWVILDFWGSWCPWCIKGFPKLKEAYGQYKGKLEVIGVDCNDPEQVWKDAVKKYDLPWVNVYNPKDTSILSDYAVQGFPTKVVVSPDGKIADITVGEDPSFFDKLANLLSDK